MSHNDTKASMDDMNGNGNHPAAYAHGKGQMLCVEDVEMNNRVRRKLDYAIMPCL